jgi:hypothetical protein
MPWKRERALQAQQIVFRARLADAFCAPKERESGRLTLQKFYINKLEILTIGLFCIGQEKVPVRHVLGPLA